MIELLIALLYSMIRMFSAYILSLILSVLIGVAMARNKYIESLLLPVLDVLQSIPILGFFPIALLLLIRTLPGFLGVELAIIFLIVTSMIWNMIFGVYSSIKSLDPSIYDLVRVYRFSPATTFFRIYIPASIKAIAANSTISWAGGWFFITSAEIITAGTTEIKVLGIGSYIVDAFETGDLMRMYLAIGVLLIAIVSTYIFLWNPMSEEAGFAGVISVNIIYRYVRRFFVQAYDHVVSLMETSNISIMRSLERISSNTPYVFIRTHRTTLAMIILSIILFFLWRERYYSMSIGGVIILPNISPEDVIFNLLLSLGRVLGVLFLSLIISLFLAYFSYRSMRHVSRYIVLSGEVLASIPAILWWPILSSLAEKSVYGAYTVSLVVFLQGSLWYSFFSILIFGLSSLRRDFIDLADVYRIKRVYFIRSIFIPMLIPSISSGMLSSWGGAWNSTIAAEYFSTENMNIDLGGIGALMVKASERGDIGELIILVLILSLTIIFINKIFWRQIFKSLSRRFPVE
ncbi:MAG: ABC transporter permease subunit [Sulfolobales archaeon]